MCLQPGDVADARTATATDDLHTFGINPNLRLLCELLRWNDLLELPVGHLEVAAVRVNGQSRPNWTARRAAASRDVNVTVHYAGNICTFRVKVLKHLFNRDIPAAERIDPAIMVFPR